MREAVHRVGIEDKELVEQRVQHQDFTAKARGARRKEPEHGNEQQRSQEDIRIDVQETLQGFDLCDGTPPHAMGQFCQSFDGKDRIEQQARVLRQHRARCHAVGT